MKEIWKDIPGYEEYYQVSSNGRIRSLDREITYKDNRKSRFLRGGIKAIHADKDGYSIVRLSRNNKQNTHRLNVIVAKAFIPNPENKPTVNHLNSIRDDNRIENLQWATISEQQYHAYNKGNRKPIRGEDCSFSKLKKQQVLEIRLLYSQGKGTYRSLSKKFGVSKTLIGEIIKKNIWPHI